MPPAPTLLAFSIVVALAGLAGVALWIVGTAVITGGRRDDPEDADARSASRFTIPVSIIVPMSGDLARASATIDALAALRYPEFEIVAVSDSAAAIEGLAARTQWGLEPKEFFYRRSIDTAPVSRIFRSAREPRLIVIVQKPGPIADALNCGLNMARYRYVLCLPPDIEFDEDALLRLMAAPLRDPATTIGASNHVEAAGALGRLSSFGSLMASRLVWRGQRQGFPAPGSVAVWRRDAVIEAGGFSRTAADLDVDLARRLLFAPGLEPGARRFHRGADIFGRARTPGAPDRSGAGARLLSAARLLASSTPRRMRTCGSLAILLFAASEFLSPLAQAWVLGGLALGAGLGWFPWSAVLFGWLMIACGLASVSAASLLVRGGLPGAPDGPQLKRALSLTPAAFAGRLARYR